MSERVKYVCLRCGNVYESRAKKPQCPVCRSKRKMKFEEFLKLPKEEQDRILGKVKGGETGGRLVKVEDSPKITEVKNGEITGGDGEDKVKIVDSPKVNGEDGAKYGEKSVKKSESPKVKGDGEVKSGDSPRSKVIHRGDDGEITRRKKSERVKGERVKRGISVPKPKLSLKAYAFIGGLAFMYFLYKLGFFESLINHLKTLGVFVKSKPEEEVEHPLLERVRRNLS